jgi:hypothetical protein
MLSAVLFLEVQMRIAIALFILLVAASAASADCPAKPVAEEGGQHWCYAAGKGRGNVHLWTPAGYDPKTAVTVVYVHGHDLDAPKRGAAHYVDRVWETHRLAEQFAESGIGALFVAVEGPLNDWQKVKWTSLGDLLKSVKRQGGIAPPSVVVAAAHSAGIFTVMRWLDDDRLAHVIALDALYQDSPKRLTHWYRAASRNRLTLVGADSVGWRVSPMAKPLGCKADLGSKAACATLVDGALDHMTVVKGGNILPLALARIRR